MQTQSSGKTFILIVTTLSAFTGAFLMASLNIALPAVSRELSADAVMLGWLTIANIMTSAILLIPIGRYADTHNRHRIYIVGSIIQATTSFLAAWAPNAILLLIARIFHGIAASMTMVTYSAILLSAYPPNQRGRVLGINVAAVYIGISLSPLLGGFLTQNFGWRSIYIFSGCAVSIICILLLWKLREEPVQNIPPPFDLPGAFILGITLFALIWGLSELPDYTGIISIIVGVLSMVLFIYRESHTKHPLLDLNLFKNNAVFAFSNLAALINYCATFSVSFLLSLYLQYIKGYSPQYAGLIMVIQPAIQAIVSPVSGRLSDKLEPRFLSSLGMALTAAGLILLIFIGSQTPLSMVILILVILGLGFGIFSSPNTNAIMGSVDKSLYSIASAVTSTSRTVGQSLSLGIVTLLFAQIIGPQQITESVYPLFLKSNSIAFTIFAFLCIAGIFASLARGKTHNI